MSDEPRTQISEEILGSDSENVIEDELSKDLASMDVTPRVMTEHDALRLESLLRTDEMEQLDETYGQRSTVKAGERRQHAAEVASERQNSVEDLLTLTPDNPLMARFQAALRQHLLHQNEKLRMEIAELEGETKLKEREAEERGIDIAEKLHKKRKQYKTAEDYKLALTEDIQTRSRMQETVQKEKSKLKTLSEILLDNEKEEANLRADTVSMKNFVQRLSDYEAEQTSELKVSQRISQKTLKDINLFLNEKQKQDIIMFKITDEILRLESVLKETEQKSEVKKLELNEMRQAIAEGTADIEVVQTQNKRILQIWNRMLIEIQHKNLTFAKVQAALREAESQFSVLCAQVDSYARDAKKEMKLSQDLTEKETKTSETFGKLQRETIELVESCQKSDTELKKISDKNQSAKRELVQVQSSTRSEKGRLLTSEQKIQRLKEVKFKLEEEVLELLQNKAVNNKSIFNLRKKIQEVSQKINKQEAYSTQLENNVTKMMLEVEIEKGALILTKKALEDSRKVCENKENELRQLEMKLKQTKDAIKVANARCDERAKKLEVLKEHNKEISGCVEEEIMKTLKKNIKETQEKTDQLKQSWLRQQNEIVLLAQKRNKQVHMYNTLKKQLLILEQKNLKTDYNLEVKKSEKWKRGRSIKSLLLKIAKLNEEYYKHQTQIETIDAANYVMHNQYSGELKVLQISFLYERLRLLVHEISTGKDDEDAEEEILELTKEIEYLEMEKEDMSQAVSVLQQEFLAWEKKCQMIGEARQKLLKEQAAEGEIGTMKAEIHRMQVRYGQLLKAQEKLSQDMEMCIIRRDGIVDEAFSREKKDTRTHLRHQLKRKLDDLRTKTKHVIMETKKVEKECIETEAKKGAFEKELSAKQDQLAALKLTTAQMEDQLQEGQLHKQKNLELLVRKQRKGHQYADIKANKYRLLFANEASLQIELQRQVTTNLDLVSVIECLLVDFPPLANQLTRILNTLQLSCL